MPPPRIRADNPDGQYFLTLTVERWYYLFDRHGRWPILADSLAYYRSHKGLKIYGFVFMLNHIHLIVQAPDTAGAVRDFKHFTTSALRANLARTEPRVADLFRTESGGTRIWQAGNAAKAIGTEAFFLQKLAYMHENPVRKQYVAEPAHWYWSSANPHCPLRPDPFW